MPLFYLLLGPLFTDSQHCSNNEEHVAGKRENRKGFQRNCPGVRVGIHKLHYIGSIGQVPPRKAKNNKWRRPSMGHVDPRFRQVRRAPQALLEQVSGGGSRRQTGQSVEG